MNIKAALNAVAFACICAFGQPDYLLLPATGNTGIGQSKIQYNYAYVGGPANGYTVFDESGNAVRSASVQYGPSGEVLGAISGSGAPVQYSYDAAYRLTSITDGNGNATQYTYGNPAGYLSSIVDPGLGTEQFSQYDGNGDPEIHTGIDGITQTYSHDLDGDLSGLAVSNPDVPNYASLSVTPTIDEFDRVTGYTTGDTGYPGSETVTYGFTANNAYVNSVTRAYVGGPAPTIGYSYYDDFNRNTMTASSMGTFTYGHDADGNTTSVTDPSGASAGYQWSPDGLLKTLSHASGGATADTTTYSYNPLNMLTDAKTVGASGTLAEFGGAGGGGAQAITYDALGDTLSVPTNVNGATGTSSYGYDAQSQLTSETTASGVSNAYSYDNAGNATLVRGYGTAFNSANEDASIGYSVGDPRTVEGQSAGYDGLDRLTSIGSETNTYTGDGLRESTTAGGTTTYFVYDGDQPLGEVNAQGNATATNLFGPTGLTHRSDGGGAQFYVFDTQGNTAARIDNNGNVLDTHAFDAYGKEATSDSTNDPFVGFGAQYGYYSDHATGLALLGHRFYDPVTARFVTRDPIGDLGGLNNYEYASNNPLRYVDPSGFNGYSPWSINSVDSFYRYLYTGNAHASNDAYNGALGVVGEAVPDRAPDYVSLNVGRAFRLKQLGIGPAFSVVTFDRFGKIYTSPGFSVGTPGWGTSIMAGYIDTGTGVPPTAQQINSFIVSHGVYYNAGCIFSVGQTWSTIGHTVYNANEFGFSSPDNISAGYSFGVQWPGVSGPKW